VNIELKAGGVEASGAQIHGRRANEFSDSIVSSFDLEYLKNNPATAF